MHQMSSEGTAVIRPTHPSTEGTTVAGDKRVTFAAYSGRDLRGVFSDWDDAFREAKSGPDEPTVRVLINGRGFDGTDLTKIEVTERITADIFTADTIDLEGNHCPACGRAC
jgi:hypothetical protein